MDAILTALSRFSAAEPTILVHAPFAHKANLTPLASFRPTLKYDLGGCKGAVTAVFASRDKAETLGLIASVLTQNPARMLIFWPNDWGGKGLKGHLTKLGLSAGLESKLHAQMAYIENPEAANTEVLGEWIAAATAKTVPNTNDLKAEAGLFSYRAVDPASEILLAHVPASLKGKIADFGCGWGYLSDNLLRDHAALEKLYAIDDDQRAVNRTKGNISDPRLEILWRDITRDALPDWLDAVVMNPPFHMHGKEDRGIGQTFIERAAQSLKPNGVLYMVANRHLPYERHLTGLFKEWRLLADLQGYKVIEAIKGK